jgi:hypothetical protein
MTILAELRCCYKDENIGAFMCGEGPTIGYISGSLGAQDRYLGNNPDFDDNIQKIKYK